MRCGGGLPAELDGHAGAAVAVLGHVAFGVLAELEQAVGVVVAVLLHGSDMALAFLVDDDDSRTWVLERTEDGLHRVVLRTLYVGAVHAADDAGDATGDAVPASAPLLEGGGVTS
jgi:hypothetical protein